jgi:aminocarboxymuconate-semialdehyde decarboxylase
VLDRLPHLRIAFAHGGGNFVPLLGRIDHGYRVRPEMKSGGASLPSSYLRRLYFDSITHDPELLERLLRCAGSDRIMLGSDYPFDMGIADPLSQLASVTLSEDEKIDILHRTAQQFLKLPNA